jgi:hypothetical protein
MDLSVQGQYSFRIILFYFTLNILCRWASTVKYAIPLDETSESEDDGHISPDSGENFGL